MLPQNLVSPDERQTTDMNEARNLLETIYKTQYEVTAISDLTLHDDGSVEYWVPSERVRRRRPITQSFLESIAKYIRMPLNYAYDCSFPLFKHNFETRKTLCARGVALCINRGIVINTAPADYDERCAHTPALLDVLKFDEKFWTLQRARLSDEGISISLIHRSQLVRPKPGDDIQTGIRLTNSETGGRYAKAALFTYRLVCSNGTVMPSVLGQVWWNSDKRMHQSSKITSFHQKLTQLLNRAHPAIKSFYAAVADRPLLERDFVLLHRRLQYALHSSERVDQILGIEAKLRSSIVTRVRHLDMADRGDPTPWLAYDIHNRITAAARNIAPSRRSTRFALRERLEEIGGDLLNFSRN